MIHSPFMQEFNELPNTLRIFPLSGAILLRGSHLPLHIFEPRYVNMVRDAMRTDQLIGMIQPCEERAPYNLYDVGCAGRISRYEEGRDGKIEIELTGLCRFGVLEELSSTRGYRMIVPDWSTFEEDYSDDSSCDEQCSDTFKAILHGYLESKNIKADWGSMNSLDAEILTKRLLGYLPLSVEDKQIILEAEDMATRVRIFTAVLNGGQTLTIVKH